MKLMNVIAKFDKELDEYYVACPKCGEIIYLNDIDEDEREMLDDGEDYIEYWCDECDTELLVKGPNRNQDGDVYDEEY